jgi:hypothetical protein
MIQKDTTQKLSVRVLLYGLIGGIPGNILGSVFFTAIPFMFYQLIPYYFQHRDFNMSVFISPAFGWSALAVFVFNYIMFYLGWLLYEYTITDASIIVRSGVIYRTNKSVNFNDLESAQANYGPVSLLFGVKKVVAYSSSPAQVSSYTDKNGTHTTVTPDVSIILVKEDAEELVKLMRVGDIQKVHVIAQESTASI